jgi:HrpA-like RNA helicase
LFLVRICIVSTNIAETSLTIDGIKFVIDGGEERAMTYNQQNQMDSLNTQLISKQNAIQRSGRAGRISPGKCFRLYTQVEFESMPNNSFPELQSSVREIKEYESLADKLFIL